MIFDWYVNENIGRTTIANRLDNMGVKPPKGKHWSAASLKDLLTNVHYIGKVKWNYRKTVTIVEDGEIKHTRPKTSIEEYLVFEGKHPAIIDEKLFYASVEKHGKNPKINRGKGVVNPLAGLIWCHCGRAMSYRTYTKNGVERTPPRLLCDAQTKCNTGSCLFTEMIEKVKGILKDCINDFEVRIKADNKDARQLHNNLIADLENKLVDLNKKEISLWDKYAEEGMPKEIFDKLNNKLLHDREEINNALCKAKDAMPEPEDFEEKLTRFQNALDMLNDPTASASEQNRLLKLCIDRIEYSREKPVRLRSTAKRVWVNGRRIKPDGLPTGGSWTDTPIHLVVKLKV